MATSATTRVSPTSSMIRMNANVPRDRATLHSTRRSSAALRLSQRWGCSEKTVECRLYGERGLFRQAADVVEVLIELGETERLTALAAPYESALIGTSLPDWKTILTEYGKADGLEDVREAEFRHELDNGIENLTDEQLAAYKRAAAHEALWASRAVAKIEEEEKRRRETKP